MSLLNITFFNGFGVEVSQQPVLHFYSQKSKALFAYLVLEANEQPQARSHLAGLLWPDYPDARARRNLSQTLTALRKDLGGHTAVNALFQITTQTIRLEQNKSVFVDVSTFEGQLAAVHNHDHAALQQCPDCLSKLETITSLYTGPLLNQFSLDDSNLFLDWLVARRERHLQQAIEAFSLLERGYTAQGRGEEALRAIDQLLILAPWQEAAHRQRMHLLAQQGQRIQALNQYEVLADILMRELGVPPAAETDTLYDQILAGEIEVVQQASTVRATAAPLVTPPATPPPFQAPPSPPHFVGREPELSQIKHLIEADQTAPVPIALVGMGGIGKTALAILKAHQLKDDFADGVLWGNPLTSDPLNILDLWAQAYDHDFSGLTDLNSKAAAVRGLLAHKKALIVLDNVEDAATVRPLLPNGGRCQVLMTTRNLDVAAALNAQSVQMRELTSQNSQTLMIRILGKARVLGQPAEAAAAQRIGVQLHHLPLAIEIAAQRLKSRPRMPLAALAMRLGDTKQRLALKISDQAVRASFEVSWDGLPSLAQQVFMGMAPFAGRSFTAAALAAVTELDLYDLEDELYSLVALSLLNEAEDGRYQQHPLLADFAAEKAAVSGDAESRTRFCQYYLEFAKSQQQQLDMLEPEWDNLNQAVTHALALGLNQLVLDYTDVLADTWIGFSRFHDADNGYRLAVQAAEQMQGEAAEERRAQTYLRWSEVALELNRYDEAWAHLTAALPHFYACEDDTHIGYAKFYQGRILFEQGEYKKAEPFLRESQALFATLENRPAEGAAWVALGRLVYEGEGRLKQAEEMGKKAMALLSDKGDKSAELSAVNSSVFRLMALIMLRQNRLNEAEQYAKQAIEVSRKIKSPAEEGAALYLLVGLNNTRERYQEALKIGRDCLQRFEKLGNRRFAAMVGQQLIIAHKYLGQLEQAQEMIVKTQKIYREIEDRLGYGYVLCQLGDIYMITKGIAEAQQVYQEALEIGTYLNHAHLCQQANGRLQKAVVN